MKYNLANKDECNDAFEYLTKLSGKEVIAEVKEVRRNRTLPQNSYLHLILTAFGLHFGYTVEESKQLYKRLNASLYYYDKEVLGVQTRFERSSSGLDVKEFAVTIDKFMRWSAENGCALPLATNQEEWISISNQAERSMYL